MSVPPWARAFSLHDAIDILSVDVIRAKLELHDHACEINGLDRTGRTPLQCAVSRGFEPVVDLLIEKGAKLDTRDVRGDSAIHYAVTGDDVKSSRILEMLIAKGADINATGESKKTPLHLAVRRDIDKCIRYLLSRGAKTNVQDNAGRTPLHYAVLKRKEDVIRVLLEHDSLIELRDENGQTALHLAAKANFVQGVTLLLDSGSNVNAKDDMGNTPLHYSVFPDKKKLPDHKSFVNMFLNKNANLGQKNDEGQTPLHFAVIGNYLSEVELLLKSGAEVNEKDISGRTALHYACMRNNIKLKLLKALLDSGADVNCKDNHELTPLHWAAKGCFAARGALLVNCKADVNAKDNSLNTPLHICLSKNSTEFVRLLLGNGCEVDLKNINGLTPLQIAVENNLTLVSKLLISKGAQVNVRDQHCRSLLHVAVSNMNAKIVEKLLQNHVEVDCVDGNGQTALHLAAKFTFTESTLPRCKVVINLLLVNGANVIMKDNKGQTPVELALMKCYNGFDIVQLLMEWGGLNTYSSLSMVDETLKGVSLVPGWTLVKLMKEFMIKLKYARMLSPESPVPYCNYEVSKLNHNTTKRLKYYEELEKMKTTKFGHNALSDIFFKYNNLTFLTNNNVKKVIFSSRLALEDEFPHYATLLRATFLKANERLGLIQDVVKTLMLPLPEEIMWKILLYLSDKELKNVIEAGEVGVKN